MSPAFRLMVLMAGEDSAGGQPPAGPLMIGGTSQSVGFFSVLFAFLGAAVSSLIRRI